jgi:hypothetical protein
MKHTSERVLGAVEGGRQISHRTLVLAEGFGLGPLDEVLTLLKSVETEIFRAFAIPSISVGILNDSGSG